ncbi:MAG: hypothetical protein EZS26_001981 [Candidatus Ordinivivax streblomastigis]|jgi:hypothetical protein|uniref:Uncharacterized protein n=1 Tax=Candidatus Ordinivivax streblomastigis TaxID=2540710 RepID=A0A5M8P0A7_9BACT|nr:MAG: hypothetical protein EZS26_001981 [Candidatus Ordinivivax streblomastigis]
METQKTKTKKTVSRKETPKQVEQKISARDRIKPRGLAGLYKGQIFYNEDEDIFNLEL